MKSNIILALFFICLAFSGKGQIYTPSGTVNSVTNGTTNRVGVGTSNPQANLHINGSPEPSIWMDNTNNARLHIGIASCNGCFSNSSLINDVVIYSGYGNSGNLLLQTARPNYGIKFITNYGGVQGVRMMVNHDGKVGIGTTSPTADLHVNAPNASFRLSESSNTGTLQIGIASFAGSYNSFSQAGNAVIRVLGGTGTKHMILSTATTFGSGASIKFASESNVIMSIMDNNTVGIGTTCIPADARLAVNGKIYATEVQVKLTNGSGCFPDYVFESDYNLMPLEEVENFIKENKHLPEIPSAQEVEEKGINVADMDAALLKKIEELTLYMIQMKKENEELKKKVAVLENK